jgi:hypothetical protein
MEAIIRQQEELNRKTLENVRVLAEGIRFMPARGGCSTDPHPNALARCSRKVYDDKSNIVSTKSRQPRA